MRVAEAAESRVEITRPVARVRETTPHPALSPEWEREWAGPV